MDMVAHRFDVYLVKLDPTVGREIRKTRPCVIVTPDDVNRFVGTVLVAPMTSAQTEYPSRVACSFAGRDGEVALEQIRCVDQSRLLKYLGAIDPLTQVAISRTLVEMFG